MYTEQNWKEYIAACKPGVWIEIDSDIYYYWLGVMPPIYGGGMFACSEPLDFNEQWETTFYVCKEVGDRYFSTVGSFREMKDGTLLAKLQEMISENVPG